MIPIHMPAFLPDFLFAAAFPAAAETAAFEETTRLARLGIQVGLFAVRHGRQRIGQGADILEALVGFLGKRFADDRLERCRQIGLDLADARHGVGDVLDHHAHGGIALVRLFAAEHLEQDHPQPVDVGASVDLLALALLG